jgi:hypothetical protein
MEWRQLSKLEADLEAARTSNSELRTRHRDVHLCSFALFLLSVFSLLSPV